MKGKILVEISTSSMVLVTEKLDSINSTLSSVSGLLNEQSKNILNQQGIWVIIGALLTLFATYLIEKYKISQVRKHNKRVLATEVTGVLNHFIEAKFSMLIYRRQLVKTQKMVEEDLKNQIPSLSWCPFQEIEKFNLNSEVIYLDYGNGYATDLASRLRTINDQLTNMILTAKNGAVELISIHKELIYLNENKNLQEDIIKNRSMGQTKTYLSELGNFEDEQIIPLVKNIDELIKMLIRIRSGVFIMSKRFWITKYSRKNYVFSRKSVSEVSALMDIEIEKFFKKDMEEIKTIENIKIVDNKLEDFMV